MQEFYLERKWLFITILLLAGLSGSAQSWTQLPDFPAAERDDGVCFRIGDATWCGTGLQPGGLVGSDFYRFDGVAETWSASASLPAGMERQYACAFADTAYGFVLGGVNSMGVLLSDLWMYDPAGNTWIARTSKPGTLLAACSSFVIGDTAYVVGGNNNLGVSGSREVWAYSFSGDSWTRKNDTPFSGRWRASACAQNSKGYLLFGRDENGAFCRDLYEYDPLADTWQQVALFPGAGRNYGAMVPDGTGLLVFGGIDSLANCYSDLWYWLPASGQWTAATALPSFGRKGGMYFGGMGKLYYTCGIDQQSVRIKETWKYEGSTGLRSTDDQRELMVYPSPSGSFIHIKNIAEPEHYQVCDLNMQVLLSGPVEKGIMLDISGLSKGIYILQIMGRKGPAATKFIKE